MRSWGVHIDRLIVCEVTDRKEGIEWGREVTTSKDPKGGFNC